jgi:hypothetical protein
MASRTRSSTMRPPFDLTFTRGSPRATAPSYYVVDFAGKNQCTKSYEETGRNVWSKFLSGGSDNWLARRPPCPLGSTTRHPQESLGSLASPHG